MKETDATKILYSRYIEGDPEAERLFEEELANLKIAQKIRALRDANGLSQRALAERVGTTASVICRLENADYEGHSLAMLNRIAAAVGKRVEIRFVKPRAVAKGRSKSE